VFNFNLFFQRQFLIAYFDCILIAEFFKLWQRDSPFLPWISLDWISPHYILWCWVVSLFALDEPLLISRILQNILIYFVTWRNDAITLLSLHVSFVFSLSLQFLYTAVTWVNCSYNSSSVIAWRFSVTSFINHFRRGYTSILKLTQTNFVSRIIFVACNSD
jgi:hypothetical protein